MTKDIKKTTRKMTRARLKDYKALKLEIAQWEQVLVEHLNSSYVGVSNIDGLPRGCDLSDQTAWIATRTILFYGKLNEKRLAAIELCQEIEDALEPLPAIERVLLRERYIFCKEWGEICAVIGYSWRQTLRMHSEALARLGKQHSYPLSS